MMAVLLGVALHAGVLSAATISAGCADDQQYCPSAGGCISNRDICILEPVPGGVTSIAPGTGLDPFFTYINGGLWQWAFRVGVAIAVLNGVAGGFQIVLSNGDSSKVDAGKTRFISSAIGLAVLFLSGVLLEFLNPTAFQNI